MPSSYAGSEHGNVSTTRLLDEAPGPAWRNAGAVVGGRVHSEGIRASGEGEEAAGVQVLFVRELTAGGDLILAFGADGRPVWALDRESGIQWWYDGDQSGVRAAIAEHWESFATMPITAASYAGPHPAWELRRRVARQPTITQAAAADAAEHPVVPWLRGLRARFLRLSPGARILAAAAAVALVLGLVPWALGGLIPAPARPSTTTQQPTAAPTAGDTCTVRGDIADAPDGSLLVCAPESRALSYHLIWRSTG